MRYSIRVLHYDGTQHFDHDLIDEKKARIAFRMTWRDQRSGVKLIQLRRHANGSIEVLQEEEGKWRR